jgi:16S rRNA processing protein RimM
LQTKAHVVSSNATDGASAPSFVSQDWPADLVQVGHLLDAWGVKGWFKVQAYSNQAEAIFKAKHWYLRGSGPKAGQRVLKILAVKEHGEGIVAQAEGVLDRNGAEALRGHELYISRADFPRAGDGEYYWIDLIGLDVVNREGQALGRVIGLIDTGPHAVFRVLPPGVEEPAKPDQEKLIPFVAAFVDEVDLAARRVLVDWGLDY